MGCWRSGYQAKTHGPVSCMMQFSISTCKFATHPDKNQHNNKEPQFEFNDPQFNPRTFSSLYLFTNLQTTKRLCVYMF